MKKAIQRAIEYLCIFVAALGMMAIESNPFLPIIGLAIAWVLWQIKAVIFGEDAPEPINEDERI